MSGQSEECEGIRQYKETAKEMKTIKDLIIKLSGNSEVNKANLIHVTDSLKDLASSNTLTHYKLFARTENLKINFATMKTSHVDHVKSDDKEDMKERHRNAFLISCFAVGISVVTAIVLAKQAGLF